jgi:hypothetical protein
MLHSLGRLPKYSVILEKYGGRLGARDLFSYEAK